MSKAFYTTAEIAKMFDVYTTTVADWIDAGKLKAYKTGGGHRRVRPEELHRFLKAMHMPLPVDAPALKTLILIIDDNPEILKIIKAQLEGDRYDVETAEGGFEGIYKIGKYRPSVVLLDVMMPDLDGYEVCSDIKAIDELKGIKIIALTAHVDPAVRKKMLARGADAFLNKPVDFKLLSETLQKLLGEE